jgi:hypothetical protein
VGTEFYVHFPRHTIISALTADAGNRLPAHDQFAHKRRVIVNAIDGKINKTDPINENAL